MSNWKDLVVIYSSMRRQVCSTSRQDHKTLALKGGLTENLLRPYDSTPGEGRHRLGASPPKLAMRPNKVQAIGVWYLRPVPARFAEPATVDFIDDTEVRNNVEGLKHLTDSLATFNAKLADMNVSTTDWSQAYLDRPNDGA
ncbi:hypothetical protein EV421DRAFT_1731209 [Armillaria borealis]|uniref:Uncharacterized protein n=1 Tax=Armillaria borealis TaxID=47425 RepID=A0AA39K3A0_9AGAR|nr:hypothetical protein EV421DRAFT_1731209 [Armillaria borealis]